MSGGSMNYLYSKVENEAEFRTHTPQRKAFMAHLKKVIKALHDIEWVDSGDYEHGDENVAIEACLSPQATLIEAIAEATRAKAELTAEIERATQTRNPHVYDNHCLCPKCNDVNRGGEHAS